MIRLGLPKEPYWLDLVFGVRVRVQPMSSVISNAARATASRLVGEMIRDRQSRKEAGATLDGLPDLDNPDMVQGLSEVLYNKAIARHAILDWEGVYPKDGDEIAPVNDETVGDLMMVPRIADDFLVQYMQPLVRLDQEKNASGPARNGIGDPAVGQITAPAAGEITSPAVGA